MTEKEGAAPREGGPQKNFRATERSHSTSEIATSTSRLVIAQFRFLPDASGLKVCLPGKTTALARLVPDEIHAGMWRVVRRDGSLSDMVNKVRAKDIAFGLAETAVYLRLPSQSEPAKNGHFFEGSASPVRQTGRAGT
jgi:hypothetical protein